MKTLVIAPQPFFSPRGTPFSVYYRTMISSELGAAIDFLTYGQGQDVDIPGVRFIRTPPFSFLGPVKIGPSLLKLFHDIFIFSRMLGLLIRNRYDIVHAHEEAVFFALFFKPVFRFKLLYDMHSSLPQQLSNFEFSKNKALLRIFEWLENKSLEKSAAVITICPDLYNYVNSVLPGSNKNFLIENSIFEPVKLAGGTGSGQAGESGNVDLPIPIPETFTHCVVYAGTLESYQGIDVLIKSIPFVTRQNPSVGFIIVGGTDEQVQEYSSLAEELNIAQQVIFTGRVPQSVARTYIEKAAVLVSPRSSGTNTPLKIYEQIASGIPLVATAIYSHTQVLTDEVAFLVNLDPRDMARGILDAVGPGDEGRRKAERARQLYDREYSRTVYVQKMRQVLELLA